MSNSYYNSSNGKPNNKQNPKPPSGGGPDFKGPVKVPKTPLIWIGLIIVMLILAQVFGTSGNQGEYKLKYSEFNKMLNEQMIRNGVLEGNTLSGEFSSPQYFNDKEYLRYRVTILHLDTELLEKWDDAGLVYEFIEPTIGFQDILLNILPWIVIIVVWIVLMKRMSGNRGGGQSGGGGIFSFGSQNPAKKFNTEISKITVKNVAG
mgnify:CR=1 FL=1